MRLMRSAALAAALIAGSSLTASAQTSSDALSITVAAVHTLTSSNSVPVSVSPGASNTATSDLAYTTNSTNAKITIEIDQVPTGISSIAAVAATPTGTGAGTPSASRTLTTAAGAQDFITGINATTDGAAVVTYTVTAAASAAAGLRTANVTYTITGN